ncbi:hypothetical protein RB620_22775 [Paenibacillus sp. LHD-117]|uniref:hypothetical protein n=1 Tax=Paenibacillus sp. LHD-117 TaxID=3071412 RepID=UPI0027E0C57C|nr:hypothetical protein [Paenibacillus sp. LHD-117]MDQ6422256.1 hypothetical protein [Paenibacillus sp. LHD-117]
MKITNLIGLLASMGSIILWTIFSFYNPYTHEHVDTDVMLNTLLTLVFPACLAMIASVFRKPYLMIIAFVWSLPVSLYTAMTPSIFKWFGVTSVLYLISGILMIRESKSYSRSCE